MLYIKCTEDYCEYFSEEVPEFFKKMIFIYKKFFKKITKMQSERGEVWLVPNVEKGFKKSLIKMLKVYHVKTVVLSENISNIKNDLEKEEIKVLDGKWLYRYIILNIVDYICKNKMQDLSDQNISFVVRSPEEVDFATLQELAENCKSINLITRDDYRFRRIEQNLYNEKGIVLNISYNYKKSCLKSDIIINIDLDEKELNKFAFPRKGIIINLQNIKIYSKGFNGINVLGYDIELPKKYENSMLDLGCFDKEILYESYLYKKTAPQNIFKEIKQDNLKISRLIGKSGYINDKEYTKVLDKIQK